MKRAALALVSLVALTMSSLLGGCSSDDIVIAEVGGDAGSADAGDESSPPPPGQGCAGIDDCAPNQFCAKASCDAPRGGCEQRPMFCDDTPRPSCGCDGVTYWNDCLRQRAGVAYATMGECSVGAPCFAPDGRDCPGPGQACARLVGPDGRCPRDFPGVCWVLPDVCPPDSMGSPAPQYHDCFDVSRCDPACQAIRSGRPHQRALPGTCM